MKILLPSIALAVVWPALADPESRRMRGREPRGGGKKKDESLQRAYDYGAYQAQKEWTDYGHFCDGRDDVLDHFRPDVVEYVLPMCQTQYGWWPDREQACKDGAMGVVDEKLAECSSHDDCNKLGDVAADAIAIQFCGVRESYSLDAAWDKGCVRTGENRCKSRVVDIIVGMANNDNCGRLEPGQRLSAGEIRDLEEKCEDEVESLTSS